MGKKQLYRYFERQAKDIAPEMTWAWLRRGHMKRETEPLLIAAQNDAI